MSPSVSPRLHPPMSRRLHEVTIHAPMHTATSRRPHEVTTCPHAHPIHPPCRPRSANEHHFLSPPAALVAVRHPPPRSSRSVPVLLAETHPEERAGMQPRAGSAEDFAGLRSQSSARVSSQSISCATPGKGRAWGGGGRALLGFLRQQSGMGPAL